MLQILIASIVLSVIHASIPNHWLPLIAIGKSEKWTHSELMRGTFISGLAHTLSTVLIGIIVGFLGYKLSSSYGIISGIVAPCILVVLGIIYLILDLSGAKHSHEHFTFDKTHLHDEHEHQHEHGHEHHHHHEHSHINIATPKKNHKTKLAILSTLSLGMFLTPCVEIEAYYFQASTIGWTGIWIVSAVYTFVTIGGMMLLVYLGMKGVKNIKSHFMEEHEKRITGIVLIAIGVLTYFVKF